jgi:ATP/maltotriose-dependent transcriptional regulator MalT
VRLAAEALAAARAEHAVAGDRASMQTLAYVIGRYLLARTGPDSATGDADLTDELLELCRELGDAELELLARQGRTTALLELGEFGALDQEVVRMEHMATELRQPRAMAFLPLHRGVLAMAGGRFAEAERLNAESIEMGSRIAGSISVVAAYSQLMLLRLLQGRLPEFEELLRGMAEAYPGMLGYRCGLVVLLLQAERKDEARAEFERVIGPGVEGLPRDNTHILMLALLAEAAVELEDEPRARDLYAALAPYRRRWVVLASTCLLWPVDRSLGRLATAIGAEEQAVADLDAARSRARAADALPSVALVALDEARLLVRRGAPGDADRALRRAGEARLLAQSMGMRGLARDAGRLEGALVAPVAASGAAPRPGAVRMLAPE